MKAPEKPALVIDSHGNEFWEMAFEFTLTKALLQMRGSRVDRFLRSGSRRLWQPEVYGQNQMSTKCNQVVLRKRQPLRLIHGRVQPCVGSWPPAQRSAINGGFDGTRTGTYRVVGRCFIRVAAEPTHMTIASGCCVKGIWVSMKWEAFYTNFCLPMAQITR